MAAFDHVDAVTTNNLSNNGTSSLSHVQETVTDVDDMLDEIGFYYLQDDYYKAVQGSIDFWHMSMIGVTIATDAGAAAAIGNNSASAGALRLQCKPWL